MNSRLNETHVKFIREARAKGLTFREITEFLWTKGVMVKEQTVGKVVRRNTWRKVN